MFKRILFIYLAGVLLLILSSYLFYYNPAIKATIISALLIFITSYLMPFWFKLFLKAKSYRGKFRKKLLDFSKKNGIELNDILVIESKRSNACAFSFANNATVCFNSNTLKNHPYPEIEGVMAHEIGHHTNNDIHTYEFFILLFLQIGVFLNMILLLIINRENSFLILTSFLTGLVLLPVALAISRWREGKADEYAKEVLKKPKDFGDFLKRMIEYDKKFGGKINKNPSLLFKLLGTHPLLYDRIKNLS